MRGRGRGGRGGRGGARGRRGGARGGRGRRGGARGGRGGASTNRSPKDEYGMGNETSQVALDINKNLKSFFVGTASFEQHFKGQQQNRNRYAAGLKVLDKTGVEIAQNARVRALAAAWARRDHGLADWMLSQKDLFGLVEVLKALTLLDSGRCIRVEEKRMRKLQLQNNGKIKPKVMGKIKYTIDNLKAIKPQVGSASGAICNHIKNWVAKFTEAELEYFALNFPTEPWRKLADICHFHPKEDFPNMPWFLSFCFGAPAPEDSMVRRCRDITEDNVNDLYKEFDIPYTHVRQYSSKLTVQSKERIAATDKLEQIIWYYEDLECAEVDKVILHRIREKKESLNLPYGKLMERLLCMKMIRENIPKRSIRYWGYEKQKKTDNQEFTKAPFLSDLLPVAQRIQTGIKLALETPVVVVGDRSGSMEVAIRTSTIIASLLTAITSAKLVFFDHENMEAEFIPTNIEEVLKMACTIQTGGSTIPAASLWPFYERKEVVKTFIVVTDEEENGSWEGYRFSALFDKYYKEVYPAKLVFVSFLRHQHAEGCMTRELENLGIKVMQFRFNTDQPDLKKLDTMLGLLSTETEDFDTQVKAAEKELNFEEKLKTEAVFLPEPKEKEGDLKSEENNDNVMNEGGDLKSEENNDTEMNEGGDLKSEENNDTEMNEVGDLKYTNKEKNDSTDENKGGDLKDTKEEKNDSTDKNKGVDLKDVGDMELDTSAKTDDNNQHSLKYNDEEDESKRDELDWANSHSLNEGWGVNDEGWN